MSGVGATSLVRVLFITHQYGPGMVGGTEELVRGLATRLRAAGHEAVVLTTAESASQDFRDYGFRVSEFDGAPLWSLRWNMAGMGRKARAEFDQPPVDALVMRAVRDIKPDVVHVAHLMKLGGGVIPALKAGRIPSVVTLSDFWPLCLRHTLMKHDGALCETGPDHALRCLACAGATHGFARPPGFSGDEEMLWQMARAALEGKLENHNPTFREDVDSISRRTAWLRDSILQADRIIALSEHQRGLFLRHGYPAERVQFIPHGIETAPLAGVRAQRHRAAGATQEPRRIVFIGPLAAHKGPHILVDAMRRAPDAIVKLELHGPDGADARYAARLRQDAAGDVRITFHPAFPPEKLDAVLRDAFALAAPAQWYENAPLAVKSALWCGVPVAASRLGSLADEIDADCGWLLPHVDVTAWSDWLASVPGLSTERFFQNEKCVPTADGFAAEMLRIYGELV